MKPEREGEWKEAGRRCRLSAEALQMAIQLGLNPRSLIKNIPSPKQQWKAPVEDWVREMFAKRFGDRKPEARLPEGLRSSGGPLPEHADGKPTFGPERLAQQPGLPDAASEPERNLLQDMEQELEARFERGEIDVETWSDELRLLERETPVSRGEIAQENELMVKRQRALRLAGEHVAAAFCELSFVEKIVLFGSVAAPLKKEVPRFRRFRREQVAIWHECNDVDLAVWVSDLSHLQSMKKALSKALRAYEQASRKEFLPGVPTHAIDVFLFEPRTQRFRGNLCHFSSCPRGKSDCEVTGCGAQPFLRLYEEFKFDRTCLLSEHNVVLFERKPPATAHGTAGVDDSSEIPF